MVFQSLNSLILLLIDDPFVTFQAPHTGTPNIQIGETQDRTTMIDSTSHEHDQFMDADGDNLSFIDHGRKNLDHPPIAENCRQVETEGCQGAVKTAVLVRNSTQIFRSLCIGRKFSNEGKQEQRKTWIHQETKVREVLRKLRRGEVNVLIATSVVEEGVDVQACSFVAVFDSLKNTKGYIQMKGRVSTVDPLLRLQVTCTLVFSLETCNYASQARQKNAKFFVFQDINEVKSTLPLSMAQEMERRVHNFIERKTISDLSPEEFQRETSPEKTKDKVLPSELEALSNGFFKVENGTVDLHSAKSLLNRYALSVPLDPFARTSKESLLAHMPIYDSDQLILPSHLPNNVRVVKLPSDYSHFPKKEKQKLLSLMACVRLHSFGLLNERLLPLTHRDMQRHILRLATKELPTTSPQVLPLDKFFKEGVCRVYVIPLHQTSPTFSRFENVLKGKGHTLALVTFEPLSLSIPPRKMRHAEFGVVNLEFGRVSVVECTQEERRILSQIYILLLNERWRRRSRNMYFRFLEKQEYSGSILPYLLGILTREGSLDFDLMKALLVEGARSKEERINAVRKRSNDDPLDEPRLWCPLYDEHVSYIAIGPSGENCTAIFPHEKEGVKTYHDYFVKYREFELSSGSPLFDVQRLWSLPSNLPILSDEEVFRPTTIKTTAAKYTVCGELASVKLAQTACLEALLANSHIALLCSMLPQFLFVYERFLNTKAFIDFCLLHLPTLGKSLSSLPLEKVATAITAKSCSLDDCYEKLEWFGDAVLKIVQTDTLLKSIELRQWIPFLHEGDLSTLRSGKSQEL